MSETRITGAQRRMLMAFAAGAEPGTACAYYGPGGGTLESRNADRVLSALIRKGLIAEDATLEWAITDKGSALANELKGGGQ